jgi:hypothetical protein
MAVVDPNEVQLVLVSPENAVEGDSDPHLWIAATSRDDALRKVLRFAPAGSFAQLSRERLTTERLTHLNVRPRDIRDLGAASQSL